MSRDNPSSSSSSKKKQVDAPTQPHAELVWSKRIHKNIVRSVVVMPDGKQVISASDDRTLKLWDISSGCCMATLGRPASSAISVAVLPDGERAMSACLDRTLGLWDISSGRCLATFTGHSGSVLSVAVLPDGERVISGSADNTLKLWDIPSGRCLATLKGHSESVWSVAVLPDGERAVSGSWDNTLKLWEISSGRCLATFEGHTDGVRSVAVLPDGERAISVSADGSLRLWDLKTGAGVVLVDADTSFYSVTALPGGEGIIAGTRGGEVREYKLTGLDQAAGKAGARYTNAKVALVGESGVGKTGLFLRLCEDRWQATESTHGMMVSRLEIPANDEQDGVEREVWLWDFAGQPDYRLIHQLYMDETALGLVVFDPQDDNPFDDIGYWDKALRAATRFDPARLLVAARCDRGGITISGRCFEEYVKERGFAGLLYTGAKAGDGCEELKSAVAKHIPWERLPWTATTRQFKTLKDAIIRLAEEETPMIRMPELRQHLQLMLPNETIDDDELRAVVGLMQGQGVLQILSFGDFILLQPEWINRYASVVVRMAREHTDEMGVVPEQQVLEGRLDYKDMKRLSEADEKILLRAMVEMFLERSLCLREKTSAGLMLVFPSYFRRDKTDLPDHPNVLVTYGFSGPLDEIYSTLVVRLSCSGDFKKDQLWKDAADFSTHGGKRAGLIMRKKTEGEAEIIVYFESDVPDDTKVAFIKYVHEHLLKNAVEVKRDREYVCEKCGKLVKDREAIEYRLANKQKHIPCAYCGKKVLLIDLIERKFAEDRFAAKVRELDAQASQVVHNLSQEQALTGHMFAVAAQAGQIYRPVSMFDFGIDGEIEFVSDKGKPSGKKLYVQLKSGGSYLRERKRDEKEIFDLKNKTHIDYWQNQPCPVYLVVRTSDEIIRWMNVTEYLKRREDKESMQIVFEGEALTEESLRKLGDSYVGGRR